MGHYRMFPYRSKLLLLAELDRLLRLIARYRHLGAVKSDPEEKESCRLVVEGLVPLAGVLENYLDLQMGEIKRPARRDMPGRSRGQRQPVEFRLLKRARTPGGLFTKVRSRLGEPSPVGKPAICASCMAQIDVAAEVCPGCGSRRLVAVGPVVHGHEEVC